MASTYSTNLKIELQATGENSGTWGTITNTNLGTALEQAIVGYGNPNYASDANLTLTYTDTNAAQAARALVLNVTSGVSLTATRELVVPTIQKQYIVQNNTTGSQSITVKTSAGTGITVPNGRKAHLYVNGTDVIYMDDYVDINGGAIDGTPIGANSASTGAFSTLSASGNVTLSGGTANGVLYLNGSKVATSGSALVFDGSNLGLGVTPSAWASFSAFQLSRGSLAATAAEVDISHNAYYDGAWKYIANGFATNHYQASGTYVWRTAASGTAGNAITFTQAMTLDASGNLGVGETSPSVRLHAANSVAAPSASSGAIAYFDNTNTTSTADTRLVLRTRQTDSGTRERAMLVAEQAGTSGGNLAFWTRPDGNAITERARITSGGDIQIRTADSYLYSNATSGGTTIDCGFQFISSTKNLTFWSNNTERARITAGGYFKASDSGTYRDAAGSYHEFYNTISNNHTLALTSSSASLSQGGGGIFFINSYTSAGTGYVFGGWYSGNTADKEFEFRGDGNGYADGTWNNNGADYAEYFESVTGAALTVGATVVLDGNKVREATESDPVSAIMGVVRPKEPGKASMVVGNTAWNKWANKYLTDDFDRYIMEDHDVVEWTDADGKQHSYESHRIPADVTVSSDAVVKSHDEKGNKFQHYKLNPAYNPDAEYTPREKRDEWIIIGLVGQVKVLKNKPVNDRWIKMRDVSATVEEWMIR